jgi:hypothetical protein
LGIGLDELKQREHRRQHKRLLLITVGSVAGMVVTGALAVTAWIARQDAMRNRELIVPRLSCVPAKREWAVAANHREPNIGAHWSNFGQLCPASPVDEFTVAADCFGVTVMSENGQLSRVKLGMIKVWN